ncbi:MAG: TRAP transporter small permease [Pseudomonadota bacterium]
MTVFLKWLGRAVDVTVILIGGSLIVIVLANVVLHLFAMDLAWVTELGELLMVWVTFLGGVAAAQRNAHMTITEFLDKLPPANRRWADCAVQLLCMGMLVLLLVFGLKVVDSSWGSVLTTLNVPMAWQYMPLPLSALLMMIFHGWDFVLTLQGREPRHQALAV